MKLSHSRLGTLTAIAELTAITAVGSGALLGVMVITHLPAFFCRNLQSSQQMKLQNDQYKRMGKALTRHLWACIVHWRYALRRCVLKSQTQTIRQDVGLILDVRRRHLDIIPTHQQGLGTAFERAALGVASRRFPNLGGWNLTSETARRILSEIQSCSYCDTRMTPNIRS